MIDDRNVQARGVPPGQKRLMKIGEAEEDGAAVAACANENNTDLAVSTMLSAVLMDSLHFFVSGVSWKSSSLETGGPVDANWLGKRSAAFVERVRAVGFGVHPLGPPVDGRLTGIRGDAFGIASSPHPRADDGFPTRSDSGRLVQATTRREAMLGLDYPPDHCEPS